MWRTMFQTYKQVPSKKELSDSAKYFLEKHSRRIPETLFDVMFTKERSEKEKVEIFRELIEYKSEEAINAKFNGDDHILYMAFDNNKFEMAKILLENKADPNILVNPSPTSPPCLLIVEAITFSRMDFIRLLILHGASIEIEGKDGLSVTKILRNPESCLDTMYECDVQCYAAREFKKNIEKIRETILTALTDRAKPEGIASSPPEEKMPTSPLPAQDVKLRVVASEYEPPPIVLNPL